MEGLCPPNRLLAEDDRPPAGFLVDRFLDIAICYDDRRTFQGAGTALKRLLHTLNAKVWVLCRTGCVENTAWRRLF
jgi:hypothetical protein